MRAEKRKVQRKEGHQRGWEESAAGRSRAQQGHTRGGCGRSGSAVHIGRKPSSRAVLTGRAGRGRAGLEGEAGREAQVARRCLWEEVDVKVRGMMGGLEEGVRSREVYRWGFLQTCWRKNLVGRLQTQEGEGMTVRAEALKAGKLEDHDG